MKRVLLLVLGFGALGLAAVGALLPVLPTTPFVLCAAGCFGAGSPRLYRWLANTRYFGEYIRNYRDKTGVSTGARAIGLAFLWGTLGLSALLSQNPAVALVLAAVGAAVSIHILTIRRAPKKAPEKRPENTP